MIEVFIVRPADVLGSDFLDREAVDRFVEIKGRTLGYIEASIHEPIAPGHVYSSCAPLGAVRTQEDAQRLIQVLTAEFPNKKFIVDPRQYQDAQEVVWHFVRHLGAAVSKERPMHKRKSPMNSCERSLPEMRAQLRVGGQGRA